MKKASTLLVAVISLILATASQAQTLTLLGSADYNVDGGSTTAGYSQSASSLTFDAGFGLGDTLGGLFNASFDWSAVTDFGLTMSIAGVNPVAPFSVEFYDSSVLVDPVTAVVARYQGTSSPAGSSPTIVTLTLDQVFNGNYNDVLGMQFTWDSDAPGGSGSVTVDSIDAVPEPTTWAMLVFGAALFGGLALRRRLAAARR